MSVLDGIGDALGGAVDSAAGALGNAVKPIQPAIDFVMPQHEGPGPQGLGELFSTGIGDAVREGPLGLLNAANQAVFGGGNARDRLLAGGIALVGGAMTARGLHAEWKARQATGPAIMKAPAGGYSGLLQMGDKPRFIDMSVQAEQLMLERPGLNRRTYQILAHSDAAEVARGFGRWAPDDEASNAAGAALFESYADLIDNGGNGAQVDIARFNTAMSKGLFRYEGNKATRDLWKRFTEHPETLLGEKAAEDTAALFSAVKAFGDATGSVVDDDLAIGLVGRVDRVDVVDGGIAVYVKHPSGWNDGLATDPTTRNARLREINYRTLAPQGMKNLEQLYDLGVQDMARVADGGASIFSKPLELGAEWYPQALKDVARVFGIDPNQNADELSRAVAAVSFLSEAEDWSTNIVKARDVLRHAGVNDDVDFQNWLRDGIKPEANGPAKTAAKYAGPNAKAHEKHFSEVWESVKAAGFKVDAPTTKKIMRLWGGVESVDDVFRSTVARKQRNFYRNIRFPDESYPVTIDRHAFDAFIGLDSGIQDRPIDLSVLDDDQVYDIVADTYRALAAKKGVQPHAIQAVIWETWRQSKAEAGKDGWSRNDPFMLETGGAKNPVFEALHGRGDAFQVSLQPGDMMNVEVLKATDASGLTSIAQPDGTVVVAASTNDAVAAAQPAMFPAVDGADRVPRWARSTPRRFQDLKRYLTEGQPSTADSVTYLNSELDRMGGLPGLRDETTITFVTDDPKVKLSARQGKVTELARGAREAPVLDHTPLGAEDLTPESFVGANSPLNTHAWAIISGQLNDGQVAKTGLHPWNSLKGKSKEYSGSRAHNQLYAEAVRRGYKPIKAKGMYLGDAENSWLIFGMPAEEAREIGEMFGQDSVATNAGFVYNREHTYTPETQGALDVVGGRSFDPAEVAAAEGSTEIVIGGTTVKWTLTDFGDTIQSPEPSALTERARRSQRTVQVSVKPGTDVKALADEFEARGYQDISVYAPQTDLEGWERAYEKYASDGQQTVVTRHSTGTIGDPHGRHVFVKGANRYPLWAGAGDGSIDEALPGTFTVGNTLKVDGVFPDGTATLDGPLFAKLNARSTRTFGWRDGTLTPIFDEAEAASGRFEAIIRATERKTKKGVKYDATIEPADGSDLVPAIAARTALDESGWDVNSTLKSEAGKFPFSKHASMSAESPTTVTRAGTVAGRIRNTRPVPIFEESFGFPADFSYRSGDEVVSIDDAIQESAYNLTGRVMEAHGDAIRRWRLGGIVAADATNEAYAWMEFTSGGRIILPAEWWSYPDVFASAVRRDRAEGALSFRLDDSPDGILAHEYGHVLHGALRLEERMAKASKIDKEIMAVAKAAGKGSWKTNAKREISKTAAMEPSELVAEAYSEILMSPQPGTLALNVYDLVQDRLGSALKFRKAVNF